MCSWGASFQEVCPYMEDSWLLMKAGGLLLDLRTGRYLRIRSRAGWTLILAEVCFSWKLSPWAFYIILIVSLDLQGSILLEGVAHWERISTSFIHQEVKLVLILFAYSWCWSNLFFLSHVVCLLLFQFSFNLFCGLVWFSFIPSSFHWFILYLLLS